ncbi:hypothetical protein DASC09_026770 [Saccharomycopsis crataegensis]|uniref:Enoyl reductase (ER) domain-containing protein n=1 Tax=Saccharomycopsis crataegensis TaxID=43959 RepID=A0AAV5QKM7_9ASCO|nr:hypothetical protein DASC09_026770 [Saccharomycopsis crataegensis]
MSLLKGNPSLNPAFFIRKAKDTYFAQHDVLPLTSPKAVRVEIKATGLCGSDLHYYQDGRNGPKVVSAPMVLGHESAGVVVEVGPAVTSVKVGDKVAVEPCVPSRFSDETMSGNYHLCPHMEFAASPPTHGTLARYFTVDDNFVVKLPDHVSLEEGATAEPLAVACHANKLAGTTFNRTVFVFGAGPVGLLVAATAKAFGATRVLVIDLFDDKLQLAKKMGATDVHNSRADRGKSESEVVEGLTSKYFAPDIVFDATGVKPCIRSGMLAVKPGGTYVQVGMGMNNTEIPLGPLGRKEATVKGSFRYSFGDYRDAVQLLSSGKVNSKLIITHRFKFKQAKEAYEFAGTGKAVKIIIEGPTDEDLLLANQSKL